MHAAFAVAPQMSLRPYMLQAAAAEWFKRELRAHVGLLLIMSSRSHNPGILTVLCVCPPCI